MTLVRACVEEDQRGHRDRRADPAGGRWCDPLRPGSRRLRRPINAATIRTSRRSHAAATMSSRSTRGTPHSYEQAARCPPQPTDVSTSGTDRPGPVDGRGHRSLEPRRFRSCACGVRSAGGRPARRRRAGGSSAPTSPKRTTSPRSGRTVLSAHTSSSDLPAQGTRKPTERARPPSPPTRASPRTLERRNGSCSGSGDQAGR